METTNNIHHNKVDAIMKFVADRTMKSWSTVDTVDRLPDHFALGGLVGTHLAS